MSSVDGRLLPDRWTPPFDGTNPSELFKEYAEIGKHLHTDAWMFGKATTAEMFPRRFMVKGKEKAVAGMIHRPASKTDRLFITIDPDADILFTSQFIRGDSILTVLDTSASANYLEILRNNGIGYIIVEDIRNLSDIMEIIAEEFNVRCISLQGGGIIDGAMLAAGLLDELSLVIYPGIDGNMTSPSIFEYLGAADERPAEGQSMELISSETRHHGIVWLRYTFHHEK